VEDAHVILLDRQVVIRQGDIDPAVLNQFAVDSMFRRQAAGTRENLRQDAAAA
jgi:hypothetical protein